MTLTFTASNFEPSNGNDAPNDPVSGKIVWEAASATSSIQSLISIELTLDGHTYDIADVDFIALGALGEMIGGPLDGANGVFDFTDDFGILFDLASGTPGEHGSFIYTSSKRSGIWDTKNFDQFSITVGGEATTPATVPEPGSLALMALGLVGLARNKRRRTRSAQG